MSLPHRRVGDTPYGLLCLARDHLVPADLWPMLSLELHVFQSQGEGMGVGGLHTADEQFICLLCLEAPDTPSYFDIYPQLLKHWGEKHGLRNAGEGGRHW